ncbi:hypothetical protein SDJN03_22508, partial [Cucurbita argyrosperma subsp. sororia]
MEINNSPRNSNPLNTVRFLLVLGFIFSLLSTHTVLAKSRRPVTDAETRQKKQDCYADIESGLWGWQCKSSATEKENCALRCLSPTCYDIVYGSDPLEEGEKDLARSQEYKYCIYKLSMGESLEDCLCYITVWCSILPSSSDCLLTFGSKYKFVFCLWNRRQIRILQLRHEEIKAERRRVFLRLKSVS